MDEEKGKKAERLINYGEEIDRARQLLGNQVYSPKKQPSSARSLIEHLMVIELSNIKTDPQLDTDFHHYDPIVDFDISWYEYLQMKISTFLEAEFKSRSFLRLEYEVFHELAEKVTDSCWEYFWYQNTLKKIHNSMLQLGAYAHWLTRPSIQEVGAQIKEFLFGDGNITEIPPRMKSDLRRVLVTQLTDTIIDFLDISRHSAQQCIVFLLLHLNIEEGDPEKLLKRIRRDYDRHDIKEVLDLKKPPES